MYLLALNSFFNILNRQTHYEAFFRFFVWLGFFCLVFFFKPTILFTYKKAMNILSHIDGKDSQGKTDKKSTNMHSNKNNANTGSMAG